LAVVHPHRNVKARVACSRAHPAGAARKVVGAAGAGGASVGAVRLIEAGGLREVAACEARAASGAARRGGVNVGTRLVAAALPVAVLNLGGRMDSALVSTRRRPR
jgi:hypothetical protein